MTWRDDEMSDVITMALLTEISIKWSQDSLEACSWIWKTDKKCLKWISSKQTRWNDFFCTTTTIWQLYHEQHFVYKTKQQAKIAMFFFSMWILIFTWIFFADCDTRADKWVMYIWNKNKMNWQIIIRREWWWWGDAIIKVVAEFIFFLVRYLMLASFWTVPKVSRKMKKDHPIFAAHFYLDTRYRENGSSAEKSRTHVHVSMHA